MSKDKKPGFFKRLLGSLRGSKKTEPEKEPELEVQEAEPKAPAEPKSSYLQVVPEAVAASGFYYRLTAMREPSVLSRVIEMFALRDLIPENVCCLEIAGAEPELVIQVQVRGLDRQHARHLAQRMRNIVPVREVTLEIL